MGTEAAVVQDKPAFGPPLLLPAADGNVRHVVQRATGETILMEDAAAGDEAKMDIRLQLGQMPLARCVRPEVPAATGGHASTGDPKILRSPFMSGMARHFSRAFVVPTLPGTPNDDASRGFLLMQGGSLHGADYKVFVCRYCTCRFYIYSFLDGDLAGVEDKMFVCSKCTCNIYMDPHNMGPGRVCTRHINTRLYKPHAHSVYFNPMEKYGCSSLLLMAHYLNAKAYPLFASFECVRYLVQLD